MSVRTPRRTVETRRREQEELVAVSISQDYPGTAADLWDACTSAERLARWFAPVTGDLVLGGRYQVQGNASGTVTSCDPPRSFAATWEFAGQTSWIEVSFTETADGATFTLTHLAEPGGDHWDRYGPGAVGIGWDLTALGLGMYLDTGASMDPAAAQAWAISPEGLEFITDSAQAWACASVAAGASPELAARQASRTAAFFTGQPEPV